MSKAETVRGIPELRVLHVIPSLSPKDGGPTFAVISLVRALSSCNISLTILTTAPVLGRDDPPPIGALAVKIAEIVYSKRNLQFYKISWNLLRWLRLNVDRFDLLHVHALFSFSSVAAGFMARWKGIPYIVRPLGVLNRWGMEKRRPVVKRLSYVLIESRILHSASAIHFTSAREAEEAYEFDPRLRTVPAIILPLPVEAPERVDHSNAFLQKFPHLKQVQSILFLSRLHQKKGIELLIVSENHRGYILRQPCHSLTSVLQTITCEL